MSCYFMALNLMKIWKPCDGYLNIRYLQLLGVKMSKVFTGVHLVCVLLPLEWERSRYLRDMLLTGQNDGAMKHAP